MTTDAAERAQPARARAPSWARTRRNLAPYLFLAPFLVGFVVFLVLPLVYVLNLSLYRSRIVGGQSFVGIENYVKVLGDSSFWTGVTNVSDVRADPDPDHDRDRAPRGAAARRRDHQPPGDLPAGLLPAIRRPDVVAALIWGYLYGQAFGPVAQVARSAGAPPPEFLTQADDHAGCSRTSAPGSTRATTCSSCSRRSRRFPASCTRRPAWTARADIQIAWRIKIPLIASGDHAGDHLLHDRHAPAVHRAAVLRGIAPTVIAPDFTPNLYVESSPSRTASSTTRPPSRSAVAADHRGAVVARPVRLLPPAGVR